MALTPDRRVLDSGIEVKPVYRCRGPARGGARASRQVPVHARAPSRTCTAGSRGRSGSTRASPRPRSRTTASATCSGRARPVFRSRSTCRPSSATTPTIRVAAGEVGRTGVAIDSIADMETLLDAIPLDEVSTSMTINAPASLLLLLYELVAEGQGVPGSALRGTVQNDILKEYIARGNYIFPPRPSMRLTTDLFAYCAERIPQLEHDLDQRLPHPRGRLDGGAGARVHARQRDRLLRSRRRGRALAGRVRRAALVLLQRSQQRLPGGREVPRRAPLVGVDHARPLRRHESEGAGAALPRADGRLDADGAAAGEQHRPRHRAGALGRARRRPVAAHELASTRHWRCRPSMPPRSRSARSRS